MLTYSIYMYNIKYKQLFVSTAHNITTCMCILDMYYAVGFIRLIVAATRTAIDFITQQRLNSPAQEIL